MPEQTIDTSIYRNAAPPPQNPLDTLGKFAGTMNAINQNKLFNQTFAARQAIGQAYQQSIDPKTGDLDTNKLTALVAGNPNAAFMAGDVAQQALARKQAQLGIDTSQLNLALNHAKAMSGYFSEMVRNPNLSDKDLTSAAGEMVAEGLVSPQQAAAEFMNVPSDPQGRRQWALSHLLRYQTMQGQMEKALPSPTLVNVGGKQVMVDTNPLTNPGVTGAQFTNTLTPGEMAAPRSTFVNGQPGSVPTSSVVDATGRALPNGSSVAPNPAAGGQGLPAGNAPAPNPASSVAPNPTGVPAMPSPNAPAGFLPNGPKLGQEAAANVTGQASAAQGMELQKIADSVPTRKGLLGEMDAALGDFTSGPGAETWKNLIAGANRAFGTSFDAKGVKANEVFGKLATQLAHQQYQALGGTGTDAKLDSAMHTNPNTALSKLGNKEIIALLKGNEDAIATKNRMWQAWLASGHGPETYGQFSTTFNRVYDPRVFQSQYLDQAQRQNMLKGMTKNEQAQFRRSYNFAVDQGWVPDPRKAQ